MPAEFKYLANLLDVSSKDTDLWPTLKKTLHSMGVNSRGLRLYQSVGDAIFSLVEDPFITGKNELSQRNAVALLSLLGNCEIDLYPPAALVKSIKYWGLPNHDLSKINPTFFRTLWLEFSLQSMRHYKHPDNMQNTIIECFNDLARWFFNDEICNRLDKNIIRSFKSLNEHHKQWLLEQTRKNISHDAIVSEWDCIIKRIESNGYRFDAMTSKEELDLESEEMSNCIDTYHEICHQSFTRVFTVTYIKTGKKVANLAIYEDSPGHWLIDDLKGYANSEVPYDLEVAAFHVIRTFDDAFYKYVKLRDLMKKNRV